MMDIHDLVAHIKQGSGERQGLIEHLLNCATYAKDMGKSIGIPHMCFLLGLLHDAGKYRPSFQEYICEGTNKKVIHSTTGARLIKKISHLVSNIIATNVELKEEKRARSLYNEILIYAILAHHGLFDIVTEENLNVERRLDDYDGDKTEEKIGEERFFQELDKVIQEIYGKSLVDIYLEGFLEFIQWNYLKEELLVRYNEEMSKADKKIAQTFYEGCMMRVVLAILKESDIYDSANFGRKIVDKRYTDKELIEVWDKLSNQTNIFYKSLQTQGTQSELNFVRNKLAEEVLDKASICRSGNFKLDMPVGSGKTYAALRFATENVKCFKKSRIFYTTAYLSVLEQNARQIRNVLTNNGKDIGNDDYILEHHSNIVDDNLYTEDADMNNMYGVNTEKEDYGAATYLRESWEAPVILTTVVQLSNTLFKNKASSIRRFAKLINSTIIVDEIQSLPANTVYIYNLMMNFLTKCMNVTLIHCTATPPSYDRKEVLKHPCIYGLTGDAEDFVGTSKYQEITELTSREYSNSNVFSRVIYRSLLGLDWQKQLETDELVNHICERLKSKKSILIVLNTKGAVEKLYDALSRKFNEVSEKDSMAGYIDSAGDVSGIESEFEPLLYYLTTNQCAAHRLDFIEEIKLHLRKIRDKKSDRPLICISTRLIEAGVDVDFDIVYRDLIGISSIIQSAGRCNREGKLKDKGIVYLMEYSESNLHNLSIFQSECLATRLTLTNIDKNNLKYCEEDSSYEMTNSIYMLLDEYYKRLYKNINNNSLELSYPLEKSFIQQTLLELLSTNRRICEYYLQNHSVNRIKGALKQSFKLAGEQFKLIDDQSITAIVPYNNHRLLEQLYILVDKISDYCNVEYYGQLKHILKQLQPYTISIHKNAVSSYEEYLHFELDKKICILSTEGYNLKTGLKKGEFDNLIY